MLNCSPLPMTQRALPTTLSWNTAAGLFFVAFAAGIIAHCLALACERLASSTLGLILLYIASVSGPLAAVCFAVSRCVTGTRALLLSILVIAGAAHLGDEVATLLSRGFRSSDNAYRLLESHAIGICISLVLTCLLTVLAVAVRSIMCFSARAQTGHLCPFCCYDLVGLQTSICPECGSDRHVPFHTTAVLCRCRTAGCVAIIIAIIALISQGAWCFIYPVMTDRSGTSLQWVFINSDTPHWELLPANSRMEMLTDTLGVLCVSAQNTDGQTILQIYGGCVSRDGQKFDPSEPIVCTVLTESEWELISKTGLPMVLRQAYLRELSSSKIRFPQTTFGREYYGRAIKIPFAQ